MAVHTLSFNPLQPLAIVDIDRNLGQRNSECPKDVPLTALSYDEKGSPVCSMTPSQVAFFYWLKSNSTVVANTARDSESFQRVGLPFDGAIVSSGGAILTADGSYEPTWREAILEDAIPIQADIDRVYELVAFDAHRENLDLLAFKRCEYDGCALFIEVKYKGKAVSKFDELEKRLRPQIPAEWQWHRNRDVVAIQPPFINKERATRFYVEELFPDAPFILGMGDSNSDLGFIRAVSNYAMMPINSQVFNSTLNGAQL